MVQRSPTECGVPECDREDPGQLGPVASWIEILLFLIYFIMFRVLMFVVSYVM